MLCWERDILYILVTFIYQILFLLIWKWKCLFWSSGARFKKDILVTLIYIWKRCQSSLSYNYFYLDNSITFHSISFLGDCDFEHADTCDWQQETKGDQFDWIIGSGRTGSLFTGPSIDHTTQSSGGLSIQLLYNSYT